MIGSFETPAAANTFPDFFRDYFVELIPEANNYRRQHFPEKPYTQSEVDADGRIFEGIVQRAVALRQFLEIEQSELTNRLLDAYAERKNTSLIFGFQDVITDLFNARNDVQIGTNDVGWVARWMLHDIEAFRASSNSVDQQG